MQIAMSGRISPTPHLNTQKMTSKQLGNQLPAQETMYYSQKKHTRKLTDHEMLERNADLFSKIA